MHIKLDEAWTVSEFSLQADGFGLDPVPSLMVVLSKAPLPARTILFILSANELRQLVLALIFSAKLAVRQLPESVDTSELIASPFRKEKLAQSDALLSEIASAREEMGISYLETGQNDPFTWSVQDIDATSVKYRFNFGGHITPKTFQLFLKQLKTLLEELGYHVDGR